MGEIQLRMTSMIDVVFLLLVYFVLTASFAVGEGVITAKLPEGGPPPPTQTKPPQQPLKILVHEAGYGAGYRLSVEGHPSAPSDFRALARVLADLQHQPGKGRSGAFGHDQLVVIQPEKTVRWQHVVNAFNAAVSAEYEQIAFARSSQ